jgi:hypothetical protein
MKIGGKWGGKCEDRENREREYEAKGEGRKSGVGIRPKKANAMEAGNGRLRTGSKTVEWRARLVKELR